MRIVLDTNVLVSALIKRGRPRKLFDACLEGRHSLVSSRPMLEELAQVVGDERVRRYATSREAVSFLRLVADIASIAELRSKFRVLNPTDDVVLRTAHDGRARFVVTGDGDMLGLASFRGIRIVTVSDAQLILL